MLLALPNVEVNGYNGSMQTPLMVAAKRNHVGAVKALLEVASIDVNARDVRGQSALFFAFFHSEVVKALLGAADIDVNMAGIFGGYTPLIYAACMGDIETVRLLLAAPTIDVNKKKSDGQSALDCAAKMGRNEVVRALLDFESIDATASDPEGTTALMLAALSGD